MPGPSTGSREASPFRWAVGRTAELGRWPDPESKRMHDLELSNAVLLCDEPAVASILAHDRSRALRLDEHGRTLLMTAVSLGMEANGVSLPILGALLDAGVH